VKFRNIEECEYLNYENHIKEGQYFIDFLHQNTKEILETPLISIVQVVQNENFEVYSKTNQIFKLEEISKSSMDLFLKHFEK
jgi:hypothetical protein